MEEWCRVQVIIPGKKKELFLLLANLFECNDKNSWNLIGHLMFQNKNLKFLRELDGVEF